MARLRAVADGETAPAVADPIASVADAATRGTHLDMLQQMQLVVARALDNAATPAVALAALANRALDISREIESLEKAAEQEAREHSEATADEVWDASAI